MALCREEWEDEQIRFVCVDQSAQPIFDVREVHPPRELRPFLFVPSDRPFVQHAGLAEDLADHFGRLLSRAVEDLDRIRFIEPVLEPEFSIRRVNLKRSLRTLWERPEEPGVFGPPSATALILEALLRRLVAADHGRTTLTHPQRDGHHNPFPRRRPSDVNVNDLVRHHASPVQYIDGECPRGNEQYGHASSTRE